MAHEVSTYPHTQDIQVSPPVDDKLSENLDNVLCQFFDTLSELYKTQAEFDEYMKTGLLQLARARYTMGAKSVSPLQYDENSMSASVTVDIQAQDSIDYSRDLFLMRRGEHGGGTELSTSTPHQESEASGLRKRKPIQHEEINSEGDGDSKEGGIKAAEVETIGQMIGSSKETSGGHSATKNSADPIRWFGVLVPQSLRQSQANFQKCTQSAVSLANLKCRLMCLRDNYTKLLEEKMSQLKLQ